MYNAVFWPKWKKRLIFFSLFFFFSLNWWSDMKWENASRGGFAEDLQPREKRLYLMRRPNLQTDINSHINASLWGVCSFTFKPLRRALWFTPLVFCYSNSSVIPLRLCRRSDTTFFFSLRPLSLPLHLSCLSFHPSLTGFLCGPPQNSSGARSLRYISGGPLCSKFGLSCGCSRKSR